MARITQKENPDHYQPTKPTLDQLKRDLVERCQQAGMDVGFAKYFWEEVCPAYDKRYEQPHVVAVQGAQNSTRWVEPYRYRIWQCLETYLAMTAQERTLIHSGIEDGVRWKGEPITQYLDICGETQKMREIGIDAYKAQVIESIEKYRKKVKEDSHRG